MSYKLRFTSDAIKDIARHKKAGDKKPLQKIEVLLEELSVHPKTRTRQPEKLKYDLEGFYSRRINRKHRLVYEIQDEIITVFILNAYSHSEDK